MSQWRWGWQSTWFLLAVSMEPTFPQICPCVWEGVESTEGPSRSKRDNKYLLVEEHHEKYWC